MPTTPPSRSSRQVSEALILPLLCLHGGGGNDLSYLSHIIIVHYNASYKCGKCLKQAFISSSALHNHKKVCLGLTSKKFAGASDGKPSSGGGDSSCGGSSKAAPKSMARLPLPNPRAQVPPLPLSHHHATVDGRPPATTSPTRTRPRRERGQMMQAQPRKVLDTQCARTVAATNQTPHRCLQARASFQEKTLLHSSCVFYNLVASSIINGSECKEQTYNVM